MGQNSRPSPRHSQHRPSSNPKKLISRPDPPHLQHILPLISSSHPDHGSSHPDHDNKSNLPSTDPGISRCHYHRPMRDRSRCMLNKYALGLPHRRRRWSGMLARIRIPLPRRRWEVSVWVMRGRRGWWRMRVGSEIWERSLEVCGVACGGVGGWAGRDGVGVGEGGVVRLAVLPPILEELTSAHCMTMEEGRTYVGTRVGRVVCSVSRISTYHPPISSTDLSERRDNVHFEQKYP